MNEALTSASSTLMSVAVLCDVRVYGRGLALLLQKHRAFNLVLEGPCGLDVLRQLSDLKPDVVLVDATALCDTSLFHQILEAAPSTSVVACGVIDQDQALHCAELGVAAFLPADADSGELADAVMGVASGEFRCSPRVAALLLKRVSSLHRGDTLEVPRETRLTARERSVLALIEGGLSNKEIAEKLGIEVSTVKNHVHHILEKLHASRRQHAAARFRRSLRGAHEV